MANNPVRLIAAVLMLVSISNVHTSHVVHTVNVNIANDWPDSRYIVHGNGTVTDTIIGLMWQRCSAGQSGSDCSDSVSTTHTWQQALALADTGNTAGYSDWRLPNKKELISIVAYDRYYPSINTVAFPNTALAYYWSSSPNASDSEAVGVVAFGFGFDNDNNRDSYNRVRLVRSGQ